MSAITLNTRDNKSPKMCQSSNLLA